MSDEQGDPSADGRALADCIIPELREAMEDCEEDARLALLGSFVGGVMGCVSTYLGLEMTRNVLVSLAEHVEMLHGNAASEFLAESSTRSVH